jgi:hypothetical protein
MDYKMGSQSKLQRQVRSNIASCKHESVVVNSNMKRYAKQREQGQVNCNAVIKELVEKYKMLANE